VRHQLPTRSHFTPALLALLAVLTASPLAHADVIYALGESPTTGFVLGSAAGETPRGWDFRVNAANLEVVEMGVDGATSSSIPITLTLWNTATETLLAQATTVPAAGWDFVSLATPVLLTQGGEYSVIGWADPASSPWYQYSNSPASAFEPTGAIQYLDVRFGNGISADTFPPSVVNSGQFGVVDIGYETAPEPSSFALLAAGAIGLAGYGWRRAAKTARSAGFDRQADDPHILSFPSHSAAANAAQRAA